MAQWREQRKTEEKNNKAGPDDEGDLRGRPSEAGGWVRVAAAGYPLISPHVHSARAPLPSHRLRGVGNSYRCWERTGILEPGGRGRSCRYSRLGTIISSQLVLDFPHVSDPPIPVCSILLNLKLGGRQPSRFPLLEIRKKLAAEQKLHPSIIDPSCHPWSLTITRGATIGASVSAWR